MRVDIPETFICEPQTNQSNEKETICLSYLILLALHAFLLYKYLRSMLRIGRADLSIQLDRLDMAIVGLGVLRSLVLCLWAVGIDSTMVSAVLVSVWSLLIIIIYLRMCMESDKMWKLVLAVLATSYFTHFVVANYQQTDLVLHLYWPTLLINVMLLLVGGVELRSIWQCLKSSASLPRTVQVELKKRQSFMVLTCATCWLSQLLVMFPSTFEQTLGTVLYFVFRDWLQIYTVHWVILQRILSECEAEQLSGEDGNSRNSNLIEIQMRSLK